MSNSAIKKSSDTTRIGEHAAMQPLSGISRVNETGAVSGMGHGAFIRAEEASKSRKKN